MGSQIAHARAAFAGGRWAEAFSALTTVDNPAELDAADHERLAVCAYLLGRDEECASAWETAHRVAMEAGDAAGAARCAFWLAFCLMMRGQMAQAGGWLARTERIIDDGGLDCAASGYLLIPQLLGALDAGDPAGARDLAVRAVECADRFADADLRAFGTLGHGQALIAMGEFAAGTSRLDEVMVSVTAGEVGPVTSGIVYCAVILEYMQLFDLPRAAEWTVALSTWCDAQPELVPYRGQCLVHRSQVEQAAGDWPSAMTTAAAACQRLTDPPHPAFGLACYQEAELLRLTGRLDAADARYRAASRHGYQPMPGLALLQLARGDVPGAAAAIHAALQAAERPVERPALLAAGVEILRAAGDRPGAHALAGELATIAGTSTAEMVTAMAAQAGGTVLLDEGDTRGALVRLRHAATTWRALQVPYETARVAVLAGLASRALGDPVSAALELDNARAIFSELGAVPDLERLERLVAPPDAGPSDPAGLSAREREVLTHVAAGRTNREIASTLVISQHTVGRHLENIFAKLGVTTRAAATAYAYEHDLL